MQNDKNAASLLNNELDKLAKTIVTKQLERDKIITEYNKKLESVEQLINVLLNLQQTDTRNVVNCDKLDKILNKGMKIYKDETDGMEYCMIPIRKKSDTADTSTIAYKGQQQDVLVKNKTEDNGYNIINRKELELNKSSEGEKKKKKKKKKNNIPCSFCHEIGHVRSKCPKIYMPSL
ncbi:uncharacterized protein SCODWIG_01216 [Saccharomycodes ludwigii]|uniref:CCHC-type domain-containing protein n=1 Tax=Saccharomycodes ludwigii TaxID=36035 RepID=A0A376B437_9ASCO|nr:uncharacterized protein SCODWIG_01216 [Saccharomycodes ludwigii]